MSIRRGTIYQVPEFKTASGLLVLTNDEWNEAQTKEIAGTPVFSGVGPGREPIPGTSLFAGTVLTVEKEWLATAVRQLDASQLKPVEDMLTDVLALDLLRTSPPQGPTGQPGLIDYPRWSEIYYAGPPLGDPPEPKRQVAVSSDGYNHALKGAIFVRTTTSSRRGGEAFPALADGTKAVCMLPTFIPSTNVRLGARERRPVPRQFFLPDMAAIASGLGFALDVRRLDWRDARRDTEVR